MFLMRSDEYNDLRSQIDRLSIALNESDARAMNLSAQYAALLDKYHQLKLSGFAPLAEVRPALVQRPPDRVTEVITDVAGNNAALRRQLGAFARAQRLAREDEDDIVHDILHWGEDDGGTAE